MKYSEHYGSMVSLLDTRNGRETSGRLIEVRPGVRITLATGMMGLETVRLGKRDLVELNPASDRMTIRTKPKSERQMRVEPLTESAFRMMESMLQSLQADQFDNLAEMKLG